ncbi:hypothetical protein Tco_1154750 [Tanacetum coccineum]
MKCPHHYMMEMQEVGCEQCKKAPIIPKIAIKRRRENSMKNAYYTQFVGPFSKEGDREQQPPESELRQICHKKPKEHQFNNFRKFKSGKRQGTIGTRIGSLHALTETNPRDQVKSISIIIEVASHSIRRIGLSQYAVSTGLNNTLLNALFDLGANVVFMPLSTYLNLGLVDFIILDMPEDIKVPLILGRPFLSTARAKIDVYKRKITLRVGEEKIIFKSVKPYMLSLRERMELDLEARLMEETLVLNRSLDPFLEYYIELNDLNEPFELRRNQGDDLMPTIEEGEVIEEFRTRDEDLDIGIDDYPILEDIDVIGMMDLMGDVMFERTNSLREVRIKVKRFEGIITLYNGNDEVTYQMVRSHLRFKNHTNEQCNKIPPLLKISEKDMKDGISHVYQKLNGVLLRF